jgi:hypothetical protein
VTLVLGGVLLLLQGLSRGLERTSLSRDSISKH